MRLVISALLVTIGILTADANELHAASNWSKILAQAGKSNTSAHFVKLSDGKSLVSINEKVALTPASSMKLVTVAAILDTFSPAFSFKTRIFHTGKREGSVIKGDLIVVGDGDPFIVSEKLWQLAADFSHMGITKITGSIIIDNSLFAGQGRDASRRDGTTQSSNAYDAPVSAFGINFNTVAIAVAPNPGGGPALSALDPYPVRGVSIVNNIKTTGKGRTNVSATRLTKKTGTELKLSGAIASREQLSKVYRSVSSHVRTSGEYLRAFLAGRGITVAGGVREGRATKGATLMYTLDSYPLAKIVSGLNKFSNNYIADVLTKRLGAEKPLNAAPRSLGSGSYANGLAVMNQFMISKVRTDKGFKIVNGSGLSTGNKLSAKNLTDVLLYSASRMEMFPEFLASLPASGWDGTLKKRFNGNGTRLLSGKVRAKTGTLTQPVSVSALAGYVRHPQHGLVAFAIIQNGIPGSSQPAIDGLRRSQDTMLTSFMNSK